jgi:hypothetical protein
LAATLNTYNNRDVLMGRGRKIALHPGNLSYNVAARLLKTRYSKARNNDEKSSILQELVDVIRQRGGRFVKFDVTTNLWKEVGNQTARIKARASLKGTFSKEDKVSVLAQKLPKAAAIFCIRSSATSTQLVGNPRMLHKQEPILEDDDDEDMLDYEEECEKAKENKDTLIYNQKRSSNGSVSDSANGQGSRRTNGTDQQTVQVGDDDEEESSAPSTISQAVTYRIDYMGTITKVISTRAGVSETSRTERLEDFDDESASCSLSIQSTEYFD